MVLDHRGTRSRGCDDVLERFEDADPMLRDGHCLAMKSAIERRLAGLGAQARKFVHVVLDQVIALWMWIRKTFQQPAGARIPRARILSRTHIRGNSFPPRIASLRALSHSSSPAYTHPDVHVSLT